MTEISPPLSCDRGYIATSALLNLEQLRASVYFKRSRGKPGSSLWTVESDPKRTLSKKNYPLKYFCFPLKIDQLASEICGFEDSSPPWDIDGSTTNHCTFSRWVTHYSHTSVHCTFDRSSSGLCMLPFFLKVLCFIALPTKRHHSETGCFSLALIHFCFLSDVFLATLNSHHTYGYSLRSDRRSVLWKAAIKMDPVVKMWSTSVAGFCRCWTILFLLNFFLLKPRFLTVADCSAICLFVSLLNV